ncbi:MAG TPA: 16S rRNA (guanine(966)-N(2))-methyltransferase RsmD [Methylomirabilota bacterium]|nr:16S rRNA (guanine(966)-N(2))-methyltransferase RsmD [Methylomirabilota bacterium]
MRVIAGERKGFRLKSPTGRVTRPTADQVRIACLDTLTPWLAGARFLDLFAGSGAIGIEALSRGAHDVVFVESNRRAVATLTENLERLALTERSRVISRDVSKALRMLRVSGERFSLIFADPPYDTPLATLTLTELSDGALIEPAGVVVVQHRTKTALPELRGNLTLWKARRFGETTLTFLRRVE